MNDRPYKESSRWLDVYNVTNREVPPYGCMRVDGRKAIGKEDLKDGKPKYDSDYHYYQTQVGDGALYLFGELPQVGFSYNQDMRFAFNSDKPIPPKSWGKCTMDMPALARILCKYNTVSDYLFFVPAQDEFALTPVDSLVKTLNGSTGWGYGGWGYGYGWGGYYGGGWGGGYYGWGYGYGWGWATTNPPMFYKQHIVSGFREKEGDCWVVPAKLPTPSSSISFYLSDRSDLLWNFNNKIGTGINNLSMVPYGDGASSLNDVIADPARPGLLVTDPQRDVFIDSNGFICFRQPGNYAFNFNVGVYYGSQIGSTFPWPANQQLPWSALTYAILGEVNGRQLTISNQAFPWTKSFTPPLAIVPTYYSTTLMLGSYYDYIQFPWNIRVEMPENFNAFADDRPVLAKLKFAMTRQCLEDPDDTLFFVYGGGVITSTQSGTQSEFQATSTSSGSGSGNP